MKIQRKDNENNLILLASPTQIKYFKMGNIVVVDKLEELEYEIGTRYLKYSENNKNQQLETFQLFTSDDGIISRNEKIINIDDMPINETILDRKKIEGLFNPYNYDAFYIINKYTGIKQAYTTESGYVFGNKTIVNDDDIATLEYARRLEGEVTSLFSFNTFYPIPKKIENIHNFRIYGGYPTRKSDGFDDILIAIKDGKIAIANFTLDFVKKDRFRLRTKELAKITSKRKVDANIKLKDQNTMVRKRTF